MALLNILSGFKTYIAAAGLVGLAFYRENSRPGSSIRRSSPS